MRNYSRSHLSRAALARQLQSNTAGCNEKTADQLADIAEFDDLQYYLEEAHPSMLSYCVQVLRLSDDSARKRIHAARVARQFPAIFEMIADGRLHLTAVLMVAPYLGRGNATELLEAVSCKSCSEIDAILAQRFPTASQPMLPPVSDSATSDGDECGPDTGTEKSERAARRVQNETVGSSIPPLTEAPTRAPWPVTVDPADHEKLRFAQSLLRHQIPNGDLTKVLSRLIELGLAQLQKQRCGIGRPSRPAKRASVNPRHIPSAVRAQIWERDGGRCTFVSDSGNRCPSRDFLECDHVVPVARGGMATVENLRLRCRAHNQFEAERTFGTEFMQYKRESARMKKPAAAEPELGAAAAEVVPWLRGLGFKIAEANAAAALCENMADEPLEKRVRVAMGYFKQSRSFRAAAMT